MKRNHTGGEKDTKKKKKKKKKKNGEVRLSFTAGAMGHATTAAVFATSPRKIATEGRPLPTRWVDQRIDQSK